MSTQKMLSKLRKAVTDFKMIKDGDKVAVGVSGGKDSVTLLKLLAEYRKFSPERFDLIAITVDLRFDKTDTDFSSIENFCTANDIPYFIERTDIGEIIFDARKEKSPCSLCSKMRKGALYDVAKRHGATKVALGHHSDDLTDTFLMSMLYEGRLSTFAPKSYLDRSQLTLIRPMLYLDEATIKGYSKDLPIVPSKCPADKNTKREYVKDLIKGIGKDLPCVREMLFTALTHPERYSLFDKYQDQIDKF